MSQAERINCDSYMNFSSFVLKSSCRSMILLKYEADCFSSILHFNQVTKNANWKVYSILENALAKLEKLTDEPYWLMLNLNEVGSSTSQILKDFVQKLEKLFTVHPSFRLIVAYSDEMDCSDEIIAMTPCRFYFSASANLGQMTRRLFTNTSIRSTFDKAEEGQRNQIIRLITLHYALKIRKSVDPYFDVVVDDTDLLAVMKLFKELRNLSDQPNEKQEAIKIRKNVIEPVYLPKTDDVISRSVLLAMIQWIFDTNLSISADTILKKFVREEMNNFEDFAIFLQSHDDTILCGFNARISRDIENQKIRKILIKMRKLVDPEFRTTSSKPASSSRASTGKSGSARSFLAEVDDSSMDQLDGRDVSNLTEILASLRIRFALKYKINISDAMISAEFSNLDFPTVDDVDPADRNPSIRISNCLLISANLSDGEIKEAQNRCDQYVGIVLKTRKRAGTTNQRSVPLICPKTGKSVAQIPIHSQFPIVHWQLRGVFVTCGRVGNTKQ